MKFLSVFLALGICTQSLAETLKPTEEEAKQLEAEYQSSSDYTVPVITFITGCAVAAGIYALRHGIEKAGLQVGGSTPATSPAGSPARLIRSENGWARSPVK